MKKLLLVGVVGLFALLAGCGGGNGPECDEDTLPPVTEAQFPKGQAPEYVIRQANEIGFSRVGEVDYSAQVLSIDMGEEDYNGNYRVTKVVVQEFTTDYSEGYLTKPTNNVHEYGYATFRAVLGGQTSVLTNYDIKKVGKSLLTVKRRGGNNDIDGNFQPILDIYFPVMGVLEEVNDDTFRINGQLYPRGIADDNEGGVDIYVGGHVAGMFDGKKLNIFSTSFAGSAWGYAHPIKVNSVIDEMSFTYLDADGNEVVATIREGNSLEKTDRLRTTEKLVSGKEYQVTGSRVDHDNMEAFDVDVFIKE